MIAADVSHSSPAQHEHEFIVYGTTTGSTQTKVHILIGSLMHFTSKLQRSWGDESISTLLQIIGSIADLCSPSAF